MKFSTRMRYGLRALLELAGTDGEKAVSLGTLAGSQNLSVKYLENLFNALKNAGLVHSIRGARGGYRLARPAEDISVLEVVHALEGNVQLVECVGNSRFCDQTRHCLTRPLWEDLSGVLEQRMREISLAELNRRGAARMEAIHE